MIPDNQTNTLYLSPWLEQEYPDFYRGFMEVLSQKGIVPRFLSGTKDVWCVDFMPVQVDEGRFVQFRFDPQYLRARKHQPYKSDPALIGKHLGLTLRTTDIIADGGNVVKCRDKVIMTERVCKENPQYAPGELARKITELLEVEACLFIPVQPHDLTGHSDGMVRFLDDHTVLVNDYSPEPDRKFVRSLYGALRKAGLEIVEVPTSMYNNKSTKDATGIYVNYLAMEGVLFLPIFKRKEDDQVIRLFEDLFPGTDIVPVDCRQLARGGGGAELHQLEYPGVKHGFIRVQERNLRMFPVL